MNTAYSHALRVLICPACGAALHTSVHGGQATCSVCQTETLIPPRLEEDKASGPKVGDEDRLSELKRQAPRPPPFPVELAELVDDDRRLLPDKAEHAMSVWQATRSELASSSAFHIEDRFYYLTRLLYERLVRRDDDQQLRAILETAVESTHSAHYRQVFRCMLARQAARAGDPTAAEDWLEPCDAAARHILSHSVYVYSAAYVATHNRQFRRVLDVLGTEAGAVPVTEEHDPICSVLRANAHEKLGAIDVAALELAAAMRRVEGGVGTIEQVLRDTDELLLCRGCFIRARLQIGDLRRSYRPPQARQAQQGRQGRRRRRLIAVAPWMVLSTLFLVFAAATDADARAWGDQRLDVFFLVLGGSFSLPLFIMAAKGGDKKRGSKR